MKISLYFLACALIMVASGCQKSADSPTLILNQIAFVYEDGRPIEAGACISPTANYAIALTAKLSGEPDGRAMSIKFTLNGVVDEISFVSGGTKIKKVTLVNGLNIAQTVVDKQEAYIRLELPEFELVE
jgi:hypothetical protein